MVDDRRGLIRNRHRGTQCRDFSGLRFGNITPTDIDGLIEYRDKAYILIEVKYKDAELLYGQQLALERLCDDLQEQKPTLLIVASHEDDEDDIDVAKSIVRRCRFKGKWHDGQETTWELASRFVAYVDNSFSS